MTRLRRLAPSMRLLLAAVLTLCVGVWLAAPAGFMPALENGAAAIVPCPGSDGTIDIVSGAEMAMPMDSMPMAKPTGTAGHGDDGPAAAFHHGCPYSVAASMLGLGTTALAIPPAAPAAAVPPAVPKLALFRRAATRDRPPLRAPPAFA